MKFVAAVLVVFLAGCAGNRVMSENERTVVVGAWGMQNAMDVADAACQKHGRKAHFVRRMDNAAYLFDCDL